MKIFFDKLKKSIAFFTSVVLCLAILFCGSACTTAPENDFAYSVKSTRLAPRTTNAAGNASADFIKTLSGFSMEIDFPYSLNSSEKECYDNAILTVNNEFGTNMSAEFGEYDTDSLISQIEAKKATAKICFASGDSLLKVVESESAAKLNNAMKTSGVKFTGGWYDKQMCNVLNVNYSQYGFYSPICSRGFQNCIIYNKSLLDESKSSNIVSDAENGNWNIDELSSLINSISAKNKNMLVSSPAALFESLCAAKGQCLVSFSTGEKVHLNLGNVFVESAVNTMDDWFNKSRICKSYSDDESMGLNQFLQGDNAFYFADGNAFSLFLQLKAKSGSKDEFGVIEFPNSISSHNYKNVTTLDYFTFIPQTYSAQADKILFLYNEFLRHLSVNSYTLFSYQVRGALSAQATSYAFNIKYAKVRNKTSASITSALEYYSSVGTVSLSDSIAKGESAGSATDKYYSSVKKYYSDVLKDYIFTGTFDLLFG